MKLTTFAKYAWTVLFWNVLVVLWGAFVRATGSGAGCGNHWPTCNGQVIPLSAKTSTLIEFTHRMMSGVSLILVVGLLIWAWRAYPRHHLVRLGAVLSMVFIITEALVGAGLVLFQWVGQNVSVGRVISIAVHLVNTFLLLASLTLTAWWASGGQPLRLRGQGVWTWVFGFGLLGVLLLGISGSITALGDTLFPATSLSEGVRQDFSGTANFLIRLRIWHPLIAITVGVYLAALALRLLSKTARLQTGRLGWALGGIFLVQLSAGVVNVYLLAPVWMQLVHLALADSVWIVLVITAASVLVK